MSEQNPASDVKVSEIPEGYIPMSAPVQRLQVPEMPGWKLHWFRGEPGRIARAQRAGYRFVEENEVRVNNFDLGGSKDNSGNTDLGTRVSIEAGEDDGRRGMTPEIKNIDTGLAGTNLTSSGGMTLLNGCSEGTAIGCCVC